MTQPQFTHDLTRYPSFFFMVKDALTLWIPNQHQGEIGRELLARVLRPSNRPQAAVGPNLTVQSDFVGQSFTLHLQERN